MRYQFFRCVIDPKHSRTEYRKQFFVPVDYFVQLTRHFFGYRLSGLFGAF